jgi:unsaturated rhamnogalacturonyl hydrolase
MSNRRFESLMAPRADLERHARDSKPNRISDLSPMTALNEDRSLLLRRVANRSTRWNYRLWGFGESITARGLLQASAALSESSYQSFVEGLMRSWLRRSNRPTFEDHAAPGFELLEMHSLTAEKEYLSAAEALVRLYRSFPTDENGCRYHRPDLSGWDHQIWVDCLHIDPPFLARYGLLTGQPECLAECEEMLLTYARLLQDEQTGLFWHGYEKYAGRNGHLWARGNAWALLGLIESIPLLEQANRDTSALREVLGRLAAGIEHCQGDSGLWPTVLMADAAYEESTLAAGVAYGFQHAFEHGLLDPQRFGLCAARARWAVVAQINLDGELQLVSAATPIGDGRSYTTRPLGVFPWGQGLALQVLAQQESAA